MCTALVVFVYTKLPCNITFGEVQHKVWVCIAQAAMLLKLHKYMYTPSAMRSSLQGGHSFNQTFTLYRKLDQK